MAAILEPISLLRPVDSVPNIRTRHRQSKQHKLDKEPGPTTSTLSIPRHTARRLLARAVHARSVRTGVLLVQVM